MPAITTAPADLPEDVLALLDQHLLGLGSSTAIRTRATLVSTEGRLQPPGIGLSPSPRPRSSDARACCNACTAAGLDATSRRASIKAS